MRTVELDPDRADDHEQLAERHPGRDEPVQAIESRRRGDESLLPDGAEASRGPGRALREDTRPDVTSGSDPSRQGGQPNEVEAHFSSAYLVAGVDNRESSPLDDAFGLASGVAALVPDPALTRAKRGLSELARGRAADAATQFQQAVSLHPDLGILHHYLGDALRALDRLGEARAAYLRAIRLNPDSSLSLFHIGVTLRLEGRLDDALRWHQFAVEIEPDNASFWEELAELHLKRDEADKAVECWQRVLELVPTGRVDARVALGAALQDDGRPDEAMEEYEVALRTYPNSSQIHFAISGILEEQGDLSQAESEVAHGDPVATTVSWRLWPPGVHAEGEAPRRRPENH